jgi:hypothetical protein
LRLATPPQPRLAKVQSHKSRANRTRSVARGWHL